MTAFLYSFYPRFGHNTGQHVHTDGSSKVVFTVVRGWVGELQHLKERSKEQWAH